MSKVSMMNGYHKNATPHNWDLMESRRCPNDLLSFNRRWGWEEPRNPIEDYETILKRMASGEFQQLQREVNELKKEVGFLKGLKRILLDDESFADVWENDIDDWWGEE